MITIVEPKEHIARLWGEQKVREGETYRMMRYVLRVSHEGTTLLHNVVTGQLVALDETEVKALDELPAAYSSGMANMVRDHFLVPDGFDDKAQVVNLRRILQKLYLGQSSGCLTHYTILPTTACNARCYYCFEQGCESVTMTGQTADDVVSYIEQTHEVGSTVLISWFGGEPTVASHRINQICEGLQQKGIAYRSEITTNGYLFDEDMVTRAKSLWNLDRMMICVDGTEESYNRTKAYVNPDGSPYQRVMRNIGLMLDQGIRVSLRMNFDLGNYGEFVDVLDDAEKRFGANPLLRVHAHPVYGAYLRPDGTILHADEGWFTEKVLELNTLARERGQQEPSRPQYELRLPSLQYVGCEASGCSAVTITADGRLVRCPEQFAQEQTTGTIWEGVVNQPLVESWRKFGEYDRCVECAMFPACTKILKCNVGDTCSYSGLTFRRARSMARAYHRHHCQAMEGV